MRAAQQARAQAVRQRRPRPEPWHAGPRESELRFSLRRLLVTRVSGRVGHWRASCVVDLDQPGRSSIDVVIDAASITTGDAARDAYARSAEFLDVARFPEIRFRSREVRPQPGGRRLKIVGDLTIRDVTREVAVIVDDKGAASLRSRSPRLVFTGRASISRHDFGLRWYHERDQRAGVIAGDAVDVELDLSVRRGLK